MKKKLGMLIGLVLVLVLNSCGEFTFSLLNGQFQDTLSMSMTNENKLGHAILNYSLNFKDSEKVVFVFKESNDYEIYYGNNKTAVVKSTDAAAADFNAVLAALKTEANKIAEGDIPEEIPQDKLVGDFYTGALAPGANVNTYLNQGAAGKSLTSEMKLKLEEINGADFFVLVRYSDRVLGIGFSGDIKFEFFEGERAIFNQAGYEAVSYENKGITFLSTFWDDGDLADFEAFLPAGGPQVNAALRAVFKGLGDFALYQGRFRAAMMRQFDFFADDYEGEIIDIRRYFTDYNGHFFDSVYNDEQNIYVTTYLTYLFKKHKPLLSYIIKKACNESTINIPSFENLLNLDYNYGDYVQFEPADGELLAENALRYLTWGVEYTPYRDSSNILFYETEMNNVYESNNDLIDNWVTGAGQGRLLNYLPAGTVLNPVDALSAGNGANASSLINNVESISNGVHIYGRKNVLDDGSLVEPAIRQIDVWTARNIVWQENVVENVIAEGDITGGPDISTLYDKEIYEGTPWLIKGVKPDGENKYSWSLGYEFNSPQDVGGVILAYKKKNNVNKTVPDSNNAAGLYGLKIQVEDSSFLMNESRIYDVAFQEFNYDTAGFWQCEDGYTIAEDYNDDKEEIVYCYISFNKKYAQMDTIKLTYEHNEAFDVEFLEFMVFDDNPVAYLSTSPFVGGKCVFPNVFKKHGYYLEGNNVDDDTKNVMPGEQQFHIEIALADGIASTTIKTVALWQKTADGGQYGIDGNIAVFPQEMSFDYFLPFDAAGIANNAGLSLDTPFDGRGNPLPFAEKGIDSPRTFAYKMKSQLASQMLYIANKAGSLIAADNIKIDLSTRAFDKAGFESYENSYVSEIDMFSALNDSILVLDTNYLYKSGYQQLNTKPFLPGRIVDTKKGYIIEENSPYQVDKVAGVDSTGLLSGSLSMLPETIKYFSYWGLDIAERTADYYAMDPNTLVPGLGNDGTPVFAAGQNNSFLNGYYRINSSDLERSSILVPDLTQVRKGDVLVRNFSELDDVHIGIIVDCDTSVFDANGVTESSINEFMQSVVVVSVRRGYKMVTLGTWGNPENGFGGFTAEPKAYQVRRLLKEAAEPVTTGDESWEMVKNIYSGLSVDIAFTDEEWGQWLPNTKDPNNADEYEKADIDSIVIKGILGGGNEHFLGGRYVFVDLLAPIDRGFKAEDVTGTTNGNVFTNKGDGIVFYAKFGNSYHWIAKFNRNNTAQTADTLYNNIEYNENLNYQLYTDKNDGRLWCSAAVEGANLTTSRFAVSVLGDSIRPGDDYYLRFALSEASEVIGAASGSDYIASYDKKMMWRAQLYIEQGANDWNNQYPWDAELAVNEWNIAAYGSNVKADGRQVVDIHEYSGIRKIGNKKNFSDRVSYSYPDNAYFYHDSPQEFNYKLEQQQIALENAYNTNGVEFLRPKDEWPEGYDEISDFTEEEYELYVAELKEGEVFPDNAISLTSYSSTIAPKSDWNNYVKESFLPGLGLITWYRSSHTTADFSWVQDVFTVDYGDDNGSNENNYFGSGTYDGGTFNWPPRSAGLDCIGFAQRSSGWGGYKWPSLPSQVPDDPMNVTASDVEAAWRTYPRFLNDAELFYTTNGWANPANGTYSHFIVGKDSDELYVPSDLELVVPGDIFYYANPNTGGGHHIAVVREVRKREEGMALGDILLIESTFWGDGTAGVINHFTGDTYKNKNWRIVRLIPAGE